MPLTREQIRELAEFQDTKNCALSFYFQPSTPRNKAHKEETILVKDLARDALRALEDRNRKDCARADLERVTRLSEQLRNNGSHAKAVFACAAQDFWREYDLPVLATGTQVFVDRHFHLKPLAQLLGSSPRLGVVLVDRQRARVYDLRLGELTERETLVQLLSRKGRSAFAGYDGGHAQRHVNDEARQHFRNVAEQVKDGLQRGIFERWILGCHDSWRSQIEQQLQANEQQYLIGHFNAEIGSITREEIRERAEAIVEEWKTGRCSEMVSRALDEARGNKRGVTGLRRVLRSLELGEVQTLLIGENFVAHAVECSGCGHLDAHLVSYCPVCGRATREVVDVGEAIVPQAIHRDIELFYVKDDPDFDKVGNIAALLRFRSDLGGNVRSIGEGAMNRRSVADVLPNRMQTKSSPYAPSLRKVAGH